MLSQLSEEARRQAFNSTCERKAQSAFNFHVWLSRLHELLNLNHTGGHRCTSAKESLCGKGVYLETRATRTRGVQSGVALHLHTAQEELARKVLGLSAADVKHMRDSIDDCKPCQENKPTETIT